MHLLVILLEQLIGLLARRVPQAEVARSQQGESSAPGNTPAPCAGQLNDGWMTPLSRLAATSDPSQWSARCRRPPSNR